jgi:hypothetical protein
MGQVNRRDMDSTRIFFTFFLQIRKIMLFLHSVNFKFLHHDNSESHIRHSV